MSNNKAAAVVEDLYLKAPRFIDYHPAEGRSSEDIEQAKSLITEIISYCVNKTNGHKIIVDLEDTEHIAKSCIKILIWFALEDPNLIMYHPSQTLYQRFIDNKFPPNNIQL